MVSCAMEHHALRSPRRAKTSLRTWLGVPKAIGASSNFVLLTPMPSHRGVQRVRRTESELLDGGGQSAELSNFVVLQFAGQPMRPAGAGPGPAPGRGPASS